MYTIALLALLAFSFTACAAERPDDWDHPRSGWQCSLAYSIACDTVSASDPSSIPDLGNVGGMCGMWNCNRAGTWEVSFDISFSVFSPSCDYRTPN